jgi:hypothetical protein
MYRLFALYNATNTRINPSLVEVTTWVLGKQWKKKPETVQLYNNTVKLRIQDLSADTEKQLVSLLKSNLIFLCNLLNQQTCQD